MSTSETTSTKATKFVVCIDSGEYDGELVRGKVYRVVSSERNDPRSDLRVIDESGEDYLYPAEWFVPVELPAKARRAIA